MKGTFLMSSVKERILRTLEEEYIHYEDTVDELKDAKKALHEKLYKEVMSISSDSLDLHKGRSYENYTKMVQAVQQSFDSIEKTALNGITAKLKYKESQRADNTSEQVLQILSSIHEGKEDFTKELETQEKEIEERFLTDNLPPIEEWEKKTDPNDLNI